MKSKKFCAAEEHFAKKQAQYEAKIKALQATNAELSTSIAALIVTNQDLRSQVETLLEHNERLLTYTELTMEDIQSLIDADRRKQHMYSTFEALTRSISLGRCNQQFYT